MDHQYLWSIYQDLQIAIYNMTNMINEKDIEDQYEEALQNLIILKKLMKGWE